MELLLDISLNESCFGRITGLSVNRSEAYYQNTSPKMLIHSCHMSKTCCRTVPYFLPQSPVKLQISKSENKDNFKSKDALSETKMEPETDWNFPISSSVASEINFTNQNDVDHKFENAIQVIQKLDTHENQQEKLSIKQERSQTLEYEYVQPDLSKNLADQFLDIENHLTAALSQLVFADPVTHVYNPLTYAADPHQKFIRKYCTGHKRVMFLGMNPGPFGMAQTGVPFGVTSMVRDWLRIEGDVGKPCPEHPKRPITGYNCMRNEVSGSRFWGYFQKKCSNPETFFRNGFVYNICPLVFMNKTGKNITPPKLPSSIRKILNSLCDQAFVNIVHLLRVEVVVGIGKYGMERAKKALDDSVLRGLVRVETILHPSPANPAANKGWEEVVDQQLSVLGILQWIQDNHTNKE